MVRSWLAPSLSRTSFSRVGRSVEALECMVLMEARPSVRWYHNVPTRAAPLRIHLYSEISDPPAPTRVRRRCRGWVVLRTILPTTAASMRGIGTDFERPALTKIKGLDGPLVALPEKIVPCVIVLFSLFSDEDLSRAMGAMCGEIYLLGKRFLKSFSMHVAVWDSLWRSIGLQAIHVRHMLDG